MLKAFQSNTCCNLLATLATAIPLLARESNFIQRASKLFCPEKFLLALLNAAISGKGSLCQIATQLSLLAERKAVSPQAIHERLHRTLYGAEKFLILCLSHIFSQKFLTKISLCPFTRILIEDSTQLALHALNSEELPGHGNHLGSTAGCKIDICFDLLSGTTITIDLHAATTQDRTIGWDLLDHIQENDLILRDMGYFAIETFIIIEQKNAFWLSRLPRNVQAHTNEGTALETILQQAKTDLLDRPMNIGKQAQHPARLIAKKCTIKESSKNRRTLRESYRKHSKTPTKDQLTRCDWHLMVTNIAAEKQSSQELHELYRQRWQIELAFRGWKKSHNLNQLHKHRTSSTHLKVLVLAAMILLSLTLQFASEQQQELSIEKQKQFSMEKLFDYISQAIPKIKNLEEISHQNLDERTITGQKRKRKSLIHQQSTTLA